MGGGLLLDTVRKDKEFETIGGVHGEWLYIRLGLIESKDVFLE